jgi:hypothetical protein
MTKNERKELKRDAFVLFILYVVYLLLPLFY